MTFCKNDSYYELLRFCNILNITIVGGTNKLFKYFIDNYNPNEIITYDDKCFSDDNLYKQLGFTFIQDIKSEYYYVIRNKRYHKFNYRKEILVKEGFDPNKSEHDIMLERKIYRIYDAGQLKYKYERT